jgi:CRISPR system Cascade subunit CasD
MSHATRSGVLGLICAALGVDHRDSAGLGRLSSLALTVLVLRQSGRAVDYQTIGGGYDRKRERWSVPRKADDGVGTTVVTRREYLEGARHGAVLSGDSSQIHELAGALQDPRWGIWLGRKACIPASPVCQGVFPTEAEAVNRLLSLAGVPGAEMVVREVHAFADGDDTILDVPLDFDPANRRFGPRRVSVTKSPPGVE